MGSSEDSDPVVGVEDPHQFVDRCDFLTEGRCRFAVAHSDVDPTFARERRAEEFRCPVAGDPDESGPTGPWDWADCPHFRCRNHDQDRTCVRCGLDELRGNGEQPLLEEHHLSYDGPESHEITVSLCRWCHATVHDSWGRLADDVTPSQAAIAEREQRRAHQQAELAFESARDRTDRSDRKVGDKGEGEDENENKSESDGS